MRLMLNYLRRGAVAILVLLFLIPVIPGEGSDKTSEMNPSLPQDLQYLIIYPDGWEEPIKMLVEWWNRVGIKTGAVSLSVVVGMTEGRDDAEKIHNFLSAVYRLTGGNLSYLLLAGDSEVIPTRMLYTGAASQGMDDYYPSDLYYSGLGSNWDTDGDGIYGEEGEWDMNLSVVVGRLPASTPGELQRMIQRDILYMKDPPAGNWSRRVVMVGTLMDAPNNPRLYDSYKDNAYKAVKEASYFVPLKMEKVVLRDYPLIEGGNYSLSTDNLNHTTLIASLSPGASLFLFAGQSFYADNPPPLDNSLAEYSDTTGYSKYSFYPLLTYQDGPNLTCGLKMPFAYISSCDSGKFTEEDDTNMEALLLNEGGGFVGIIASSGVSYRGETLNGSFGNWWLYKEFTKNLFEKTPMPAVVLRDLKQHYFTAIYHSSPYPPGVLSNLYSYNYLGDPAITIYLGDVREFNVTAPQIVYSGRSEVSVAVKDAVYGTPVVGARVTLYNPEDGEFYTSLSGEGGVARIETDFNQSSDVIYLTVSNPGYRPFLLDNVSLRSPPADLYIAAVEHPEAMNSGESYQWMVEVGNKGSSAAEGFTLMVYEGEKVYYAEDYGPLPPLSTTTLPVNITLPWGEHNITFEVTSMGPEGDRSNNFYTVEVYINSPPVALPSVTFTTREDSPPIFCPISKIVYDRDTPVSSLIFKVVEVNPPGIAVEVMNNKTVMVAPPENFSGEIRIGYRVSDSLGEVNGFFTVIVMGVNDPPRIINIDPSYIISIGVPFNLQVLVDDDGPPPLSFSISPSFIPIDPRNGLISFIPYENMSGVYSVNITVMDGGGLTAYAETTFIITSESSRLRIDPTLVRLRAVVGKKFVYQVKVYGARRVNLTFTDDTDLFDIDPESGLISFTPTKEQAGVYRVTITVENSYGEKDSRLIVFEIVEEKKTAERDLALILTVPIILLGAILLYLAIFTPSHGGMGREE
ncbi:MAG: hypothetical protein J7L88_00535 [Thermoplasmata archaeon]|nr:hypothetical protein [Thermoplasmata archaeon]